MKTVKRTLAVMLTLLMLISAVPVGVMSAGGQDIPDGASEFKGHYYKVVENALSWKAAQDWCVTMGGHLVTITTVQENDFVKNLLSSYPDRDYYIGINDFKKEGVWNVWVTGEPVSYSNWGKNEPDNAFGGQDAGVIVNGVRDGGSSYYCIAGQWDDIQDWKSNWFICEWEKASMIIGRDNNSFKHSSNTFFKESELKRTGFWGLYGEKKGRYYVDEDMEKAFIKTYLNNDNVPWINKWTFIERMDRPWEGSCFGISATMALAYVGKLELNNFFSDIDCYYHLEEPSKNTRLRSLINIFQIAQYLPEISNRRISVKYSSDTIRKEELKTIVNHALEIKNNNTPFLFSMNYSWASESGEKKTVGHAIVCVGCEGFVGGYRLQFVDPNNQDSYVYADVPLDYSKISFEQTYNEEAQRENKRYNWKLTSIGHTFLTAFDLIDLDGANNEYSYLKKAKSNSQERNNESSAIKGTTIIFDSSCRFVLMNQEGNTLSYDGEEISGTLTEFEVSYVPKGESMDIILTLSNSIGQYEIRCVDEQIDITIYDENSNCYGVIGKNIDTINFDMGDSISVTGDEMNFEAYYGLNNEKWDLVKIQGDEIDEFNATDDNNSFQFSTNNIDNINVTGYKDENIFELNAEINNNYGTISFSEETDPQPQPDSVCPWCGGQHVGFFQGIIGWFHGIFARIFGARY